MQIFSKFTLLTVLSLLTSCGFSISTNTESTDSKDNLNFKSINLYLSRSSLTRTEFEQFNITKDKLFSECGKVFSGRQSSEYQDLQDLSSSDREDIIELASNITEFSKEHSLNLDKPGNSSSMFDAGQFILKISYDKEVTEIKTSVDSVANGKKTSLDNLRQLARKLRELAIDKAGQDLCSNRKFYDL